MSAVQDFEHALADYCGAKHCISAANGTATLQAALVAMGVKPGDRVATTPLTHAATSIAILNVGAVPVYCDVDPDTWLMKLDYAKETRVNLPVSLYGLHMNWCGSADIDDAAQTLRPHSSAAFTSLSFQSSKILSTGEGGALLTNDAELAATARSYLSLGYDLSSTSRIDKRSIKDPRAIRHVRWPAVNARMNELTARDGLRQMTDGSLMVARIERQSAAAHYADAVEGCSWITPQKTPDGWTHDYWSFAVALDTPERWEPFAQAIERHGGTRPFAAWRLTYQEPAFEHLAPCGCNRGGCRPCLVRNQPCPVAEDLQPRIMAFQTNNLADAERNASAVSQAIKELNG